MQRQVISRLLNPAGNEVMDLRNLPSRFGARAKGVTGRGTQPAADSEHGRPREDISPGLCRRKPKWIGESCTGGRREWRNWNIAIGRGSGSVFWRCKRGCWGPSTSCLRRSKPRRSKGTYQPGACRSCHVHTSQRADCMGESGSFKTGSAHQPNSGKQPDSGRDYRAAGKRRRTESTDERQFRFCRFQGHEGDRCADCGAAKQCSTR